MRRLTSWKRIVAAIGWLAVLKRSAADRNLFEKEGRAVVFSALEALSNRIDDPDLDVTEDDFLVMRNAGPKSGRPIRGAISIS